MDNNNYRSKIREISKDCQQKLKEMEAEKDAAILEKNTLETKLEKVLIKLNYIQDNFSFSINLSIHPKILEKSHMHFC